MTPSVRRLSITSTEKTERAERPLWRFSTLRGNVIPLNAVYRDLRRFKRVLNGVAPCGSGVNVFTPLLLSLNPLPLHPCNCPASGPLPILSPL
ncbi:hypothetical protein FHR25_005052 [Yokenella regensburgei]|nr:hypothetical protein FHR25_005052 [Yokenella regensburgei]